MENRGRKVSTSLTQRINMYLKHIEESNTHTRMPTNNGLPASTTILVALQAFWEERAGWSQRRLETHRYSSLRSSVFRISWLSDTPVQGTESHRTENPLVHLDGLEIKCCVCCPVPEALSSLVRNSKTLSGELSFLVFL